jgi:hypothetical protein
MDLPRLAHLRHFASLLGWESLEKHAHRIPERERRDRTMPRTIVWYQAGRFNDIWLQINVLPALYAAVYAPRYRLCSQWHGFTVGSAAAARRAEAERLGSLLNRRWFVLPDARREYRRLHPECVGYSWRRIHEVGFPP